MTVHRSILVLVEAAVPLLFFLQTNMHTYTQRLETNILPVYVENRCSQGIACHLMKILWRVNLGYLLLCSLIVTVDSEGILIFEHFRFFFSLWISWEFVSGISMILYEFLNSDSLTMAPGNRVKQRNGFHFGKWKSGEDIYKTATRPLCNGDIVRALQCLVLKLRFFP